MKFYILLDILIFIFVWISNFLSALLLILFLLLTKLFKIWKIQSYRLKELFRKGTLASLTTAFTHFFQSLQVPYDLLEHLIWIVNWSIHLSHQILCILRLLNWLCLVLQILYLDCCALFLRNGLWLKLVGLRYRFYMMQYRNCIVNLLINIFHKFVQSWTCFIRYFSEMIWGHSILDLLLRACRLLVLYNVSRELGMITPAN